jgi:outer membrane protein assembly factor BamB
MVYSTLFYFVLLNNCPLYSPQISNMRPASLVIATCLISWVTGVGVGRASADWPHAFGPSYDGHVERTNLAWPWNKDQPKLLWKANLGEGYSGMSVTDGRVYTQAQRRDGQYVICLDVDTGQSVWQTRYNYPWQLASDFPGPYATPTYRSGRIYYADCYGFAGCLDAETGKAVWTLSLTERFGGRGTGFGYACSPLVEDGRVFVPVGGKGAAVVAVSALDGRLSWQSGDDAASYVPCLPILVQGHRQIVTLLQNVLVAQDPVTGKELWRERLSIDGYDEHSCLPLYEEPFLFCASPFRRGARVLRLSHDGATPKAEQVWKNKALSGDVCSSVLVDGCIYGSDVEQAQANPRGDTQSRFKCLELATGRELWVSDAPGHASILACGEKLILLNEAGFLIVVEASPAGYMELARRHVAEGAKPCWTPPAVYKGRLLVRNQQMLACYQIGAVPERIAGPPINVAKAQSAPRASRHGFFDGASSWLDHHQSSAQWDPTSKVMALWYGSCLGVFAVAGVFAWLLRRRLDMLTVFLAISVGLGIVASPLISLLADRLVFTWPAACHSMFMLMLAANHGDSFAARLKSRMWLLVFILFCAAYYIGCQELFLPSGIGFLCGFAFGLPVTTMLTRTQKRPASAESVGWSVVSFSLYFRGSAFLIMWRMSL